MHLDRFRHLAMSVGLAACVPAAWSATAAPTSAATLQQLLESEKLATNVYKAYFPSLEIARKAAISFHSQLLESHYDEGYLVLELEASDLDRLRPFGFRFEAATDFIQRRNQALTQMQIQQASLSSAAAAAAQTIPNFSCYETVEETFAVGDSLIAARPTLASWSVAGASWEKTQGLGGWDMRVLKLTNSALAGAKPKLFVNSAIHAREYATAPLVLEFARWLVNGYGSNADATWIMDHHEVHLMLHTNPDGRKKAETGLSWRKNTDNAYCANTNTRGIDLNRNFSSTWNSTNGAGSSGNTCDLTYRGPSAASEPEVQAVQAYVRSLWPDRRGPAQNDPAPADTSGVHLDIHSYSQLVLWPWGTTSTPAPNGPALQTLGRKLAFFNGYTPQQAIGLYPTDGTSDAVSYGELGVAAFTIELGTAFFESCSNYTNIIKPGNLPALIYAAKVVRTPYLTPSGPDITALALGNDASGAGVLIGTAVTLSATASDARFNNSNGVEPTQAIAGVQYTVDVPPWDPAAVPVQLSASDGAFNAVTENAAGVINTAGLSPGPHLVYLQARDAGGALGAVSAAFLKVSNTPPPLAAAFSSNCANLVCSFDASGSVGSINAYQWNFGDARAASGSSINHVYAAAGSYSVTLTVSNGSAANSKTQTLSLSAPPAPVAVKESGGNDSISSAQLVSANPALISGTLSSKTDSDYYRVSLAAGKTLAATLTPGASANYNLYLYDSGGALLATSALGSGQAELIARVNTSGAALTLYLRVVYVSGGTGSGNGKYSLRLEQ